jgi:hypothetical protein
VCQLTKQKKNLQNKEQDKNNSADKLTLQEQLNTEENNSSPRMNNKTIGIEVNKIDEKQMGMYEFFGCLNRRGFDTSDTSDAASDPRRKKTSNWNV